MNRPASALLDRLYAIPFSIAAFLIVFIYSKHGGIGISPDSIVYVSSARSLVEHGKLLGYNQFPVVDFPFGYPIFLAAIKFITHVDPVVAGPYLNGFLFAAVVYTSSMIINKFVNHSLGYKCIVLLCIVVAPSLQEVYSMLWSESLFILLSLLLILALHRYFKTYTLSGLLLVSLIVSVACVTRYAGIAFAGAGGTLLLFDKKLRPGKKAQHIIIFSFISLLLLAINLYRNLHVGGFLTGNREKGITPLSDNISYFGSVVGNWLPFFPDHYTISLVVGWIVLLAIIAICVYYWVKGNQWYTSFENITSVFALVYASFIILSSTISHYERINDRLLSPLYIPLLFSFTSRIPALIQMEKTRGLRIATIAFCLTISAGFFYRQYQNNLEFYEDVSTYGIPGYTDDTWVHSQTVNFIQQHKSFFNPAYCIYSNAPESIYFNCGLVGENLPNSKFPKDVDEFYSEDHYYIVWFNNKEETPLSLHEIKQHKNLKQITSFTDGEIYECEE
ncbi:hypothetical protein [Pinibacter aurantiacus]|uniref:Uncharacterized protein n=1 Tax=Pinibacter aurantiacus TaxID=2851599 RepID=A0A9E2S5I5_9BACT|nr:hypothetical protein [Pinibacter aurantiacus]MBV4355663.1 hypothetical protein [Pinibacter aurantiacus]